jgi:hypothetical protein
MAVNSVSPPAAPDLQHAASRSGIREKLILAAILTAFALIRGPALWQMAGGMDEELFAIPGWTVWNEGVPRIPYMPPRSPSSGFWESSTVTFALPPLYYYWQAPLHGLLGPGYPAARVASATAGALAICLVFLIGRRLGVSPSAALAAAALYSISRAFYFPATIARPDMLCATLELAAVWQFLIWRSERASWRLGLCGALLGLGGLTHPVGVVAAVQLGFCCLLIPDPISKRCRSAAWLAFTACAVFSLWLLLIVPHMHLFWTQFSANVLKPVGPTFVERLVTPWRAIAAQAAPTWDRLGPLQSVMSLAGLLGSLTLARRSMTARWLAGLALSSMLLIVLLVDEGHISQGYWCYPAAFWLLGLAHLIERLASAITAQRGEVLTGACWVGLIICSLPGSGLRTTYMLVSHWRECDYSRSCFVRNNLLSDLPPDAHYLVDPAFAFDVYVTGRRTSLACYDPAVDDSMLPDYDILIVSRYGLDNEHPRHFDAELWYSAGQVSPFTCYAGIYGPQERQQDAAPDQSGADRSGQ